MGRTGTPESAPAAEPGADGRGRHAAAVARLQASYAAIPRGQTVRLAKKTSNLFRPRAAQEHGLDVSGLDGVIAIDRERRTADVQGMCTYEHLVDATLPHGLMPLVVPQLRTITLGGAVTGLGIESSSFRNGLPHESVLEMDVLVGDGRIVTATPDNEHSDLFFAFPNSYGSLGYAVRLRIELEQVATYVGLRHVRFDDLDSLAKTAATITESRDYDGERVDFLDGVVFEPDEAYLTLGRWTDDVAESGVLAAERLHRPGRLLPVAARAVAGRVDGIRLSLALGHRLVLVLARLRCSASRRAAGVAPAVATQRRLLQDRRAREPLPGQGADRPPARQARPRARRPGHRGAGGPHRRLPALVHRARADAPGVAVPAAAARRRTVRDRRARGRCTR